MVGEVQVSSEHKGPYGRLRKVYEISDAIQRRRYSTAHLVKKSWFDFMDLDTWHRTDGWSYQNERA